MLALAALSTGWVAVFYIVALVILLLSAFRGFANRARNGQPDRPLFPRVNLLALGLAVITFMLAWQALASTPK